MAAMRGIHSLRFNQDQGKLCVLNVSKKKLVFFFLQDVLCVVWSLD